MRKRCRSGFSYLLSTSIPHRPRKRLFVHRLQRPHKRDGPGQIDVEGRQADGQPDGRIAERMDQGGDDRGFPALRGSGRPRRLRFLRRQIRFLFQRQKALLFARLQNPGRIPQGFRRGQDREEGRLRAQKIGSDAEVHPREAVHFRKRGMRKISFSVHFS